MKSPIALVFGLALSTLSAMTAVAGGLPDSFFDGVVTGLADPRPSPVLQITPPEPVKK